MYMELSYVLKIKWGENGKFKYIKTLKKSFYLTKALSVMTQRASLHVFILKNTLPPYHTSFTSLSMRAPDYQNLAVVKNYCWIVEIQF